MAEVIQERVEWLAGDCPPNRTVIACDCPRHVCGDGTIKLSHLPACQNEAPKEKLVPPGEHDAFISTHMVGHSFGSGR